MRVFLQRSDQSPAEGPLEPFAVLEGLFGEYPPDSRWCEAGAESDWRPSSEEKWLPLAELVWAEQPATPAEREAIRGLVERSVGEGVNPNALPRQLRDHLALTPSQAAAADRYRAELVSQRRKPDQVERMHAK